MKNLKLKNWMFTGTNGFLAIVFGLVAIVFPSITLIALAIYFAFTVLIGGFVLTVGAIKVKGRNTNWYLVFFEGLISILLGVIILLRPELSAAVFVTIIGIWAILLGAIFSVSYFRQQVPNSGKGFFLITGILSLLFGALIIVNPFEGSRVITVLIGVYAIAYGLYSMITNNKKS